MVAPDTQKIMDLVEQKTGFGVSVLVDDKITTPAGMVSARFSVPMHLVKVNPKYEQYGDYLVALQCAMLLIKCKQRVNNGSSLRLTLVRSEQRQRVKSPFDSC